MRQTIIVRTKNNIDMHRIKNIVPTYYTVPLKKKKKWNSFNLFEREWFDIIIIIIIVVKQQTRRRTSYYKLFTFMRCPQTMLFLLFKRATSTGCRP